MKDGNIYTWEWVNTGPAMDLHDLNRSHVAIVLEGKLFDTYWMSHGSRYVDGKGWGPTSGLVLPVNAVVLNYVANLDDLIEVRPDELKYYDPDDTVDLRHRNNSQAPTYVRKGKWRSASVIRDLIDQKLLLAKLKIENGERELARLNKQEVLLRTGMLDQIEL